MPTAWAVRTPSPRRTCAWYLSWWAAGPADGTAGLRPGGGVRCASLLPCPPGCVPPSVRGGWPGGTGPDAAPPAPARPRLHYSVDNAHAFPPDRDGHSDSPADAVAAPSPR